MIRGLRNAEVNQHPEACNDESVVHSDGSIPTSSVCEDSSTPENMMISCTQVFDQNPENDVRLEQNTVVDRNSEVLLTNDMELPTYDQILSLDSNIDLDVFDDV